MVIVFIVHMALITTCGMYISLVSLLYTCIKRDSSYVEIQSSGCCLTVSICQFLVCYFSSYYFGDFVYNTGVWFCSQLVFSLLFVIWRRHATCPYFNLCLCLFLCVFQYNRVCVSVRVCVCDRVCVPNTECQISRHLEKFQTFFDLENFHITFLIFIVNDHSINDHSMISHLK